MKNRTIVNIFNIALLTILLTFGMTLCVMANDAEGDGEATNQEVVKEVAEPVEEVAEPVEEVTEPVEEVAEPVEETGDVEEEVVVEEPEAEEEVVVGDSSYYNPETGETAVTYPNGVTEVTVEPKVEESEGVLGAASSYNRETGEITVTYPNGESEVYYEPDEEFEGVLGPASSYDRDTGLTEVWYPDGHVEVFPSDVEEPTYTSSTSQAPSYNNSDNYAAASYDSGASADESTGVVDETVVVADVEDIVEPVIEEAVLGDYEAPVKKNVPFTAGLAFFSSTIISLGVLWKLGILAL